MFRRVILVSLAIFAFAVAAPPSEPDTEFLNWSSRVPGDQLIWKSSYGQQNLDFFGHSAMEISYPLNGSRSQFIITHIHIDAKENTGMMDASFYGGIGTDFVRIRLTSNDVKQGGYTIYIYGKKK